MSNYLEFKDGKVNVNAEFNKPMTLLPTESLDKEIQKARIDLLKDLIDIWDTLNKLERLQFNAVIIGQDFAIKNPIILKNKQLEKGE